MKPLYLVQTILTVFLLFIQPLISGCTTTVTKGLRKEELYKKDVQKEDLFREDLHKKDLVEEEFHKEEVDLVTQKLYQDKCSLCHELPDTDAYPYTPEQWAGIIDYMHDADEAREFITLEETEKIKDYMKWLSQTRQTDKGKE